MLFQLNKPLLFRVYWAVKRFLVYQMGQSHFGCPAALMALRA